MKVAARACKMLHPSRDNCWRAPCGNKTIWKVYSYVLHFNFFVSLMARDGAKLQDVSRQQTLKLSSQDCRVGDSALFSETIKRASDDPSGRVGKTGCCQWWWWTQLTSQEETAFLESQPCYCGSVAQSCPTLWPHGLQHARLPCPPSSRVCSNSCPLSQWCHSNISSSVSPFSSCPQSFPASESFLMSWLLPSGGQSIGASASGSVLPMNIQGGFPLGLTGLISLQSKGLTLKSSPTPQFESINSSLLSLLYGPERGPYSPTLTSAHDYWENHSFDYMDLCQKSNVSAF